MDKNFTKNDVQKEESKKQIQKEMLSSNYYADWLTNFIKIHQIFSSGDWLRKKAGVSEKDRINISHLYLFYELISDYAKRNYIYFSDNYFIVSINNTVIKIGHFSGQTSFYYCSISNSTDNFIKFEDIKNNVSQPDVVKIDFWFHRLSVIIRQISKLVPYEYLKMNIVNMLDQFYR